MTPPTDAEGSEDVNDFLLRIRELGEKRDREDEERTKKLEEEILKGRKEREARRAERARSISPTKDSPILETARLSFSSLSQRTIDPPEQLEPTPHTPIYDTNNKHNSIRDDTIASLDSSPGESRPETSEIGASPKAPSPSLRSRAGTLSWQQRPTSRDLSGNRIFLATPPQREGRFRAMSTASNDDRGISGSLFTSLPSSRESSFLRQTERDESSPAESKQSEEDTKETSVSGGDPKQPGMGEDTTELAKENDQQDNVDERSRSPSRASSTFADSSLGNRYSSISSVSIATGLGSPIPLSSAPKLEPLKSEGASIEQMSSPSSPKRLPPERSRSTSPTKGLGGFVQSAMMKRSDSISKRWSAQLPSSLNRGNSFASNRNSFVATNSGDVFSTSPTRLNRENSTLPLHRPPSSHSEATIVHNVKDEGRPGTPPVLSGNEGATRPPLGLHSRSTSVVSVGKYTESTSLPTTPASRSIDPKRWSPTKSTWLESALNRPESPRHKRQPSQQSSWTGDRQSRASVDLGRPSNFKEVTPVGLLRTADLQSHIKKPSISRIPDLCNTKDMGKVQDESPASPASPIKDGSPAPETKVLEAPEAPEAPSPREEMVLTFEDTTTRKRAPSSLLPNPKTNNIDLPLSSPRDPLLTRPKPQSPVVDFRANLRRREVVKDQSAKVEPEFRNVFGKLKKAETSNYVAPDALKENILRGKAALNATGGPKRSQRTDEFKESILKQKEAMKASGGSLRRNTAGENDAPAEVVPEAIAKRKDLVKPGGFKNNASIDPVMSPPHEEPYTPHSPHEPQLSLSPSHEGNAKEIESAQAVLETYEFDTDADHVLAATTNSILPDRETDYEREPVSAEDRSTEVDTIDDKQEHAGEEQMKPVGVSPWESTTQATTTLPAIEGHVAKGNLAGRINPALAGILSRGPHTPVGGSRKSIPAVGSVGQGNSNSRNLVPAPTLKHMTKTRARGPKRRPPKAPDSITVNLDLKSASPSSLNPSSPLGAQLSEANFSPIKYSPGSSSGWPLPNQQIGVNLAPETGVNSPPSFVTNKTAELKRSIPCLAERDVSVASNPSTASAKLARTLERRIFEDSENQDRSPRSKTLLSLPRPVNPPLSPLTPQARNVPTHYSPPSPSSSPLRTSFKENQTNPSPLTTGPGTSILGTRDLSPFRKSLPSPPVPPKGPSQLSSPRSSASLVPQADESLEAISGFFTTSPSSTDRVNIDPQLMLVAKNDNLKIRTVRKQIWEITGDGKKQDLPSNQEYILYEGAMYLCVHIFKIDGSTRSEVHLWCGDDVWDGAMDDAQAFARRVARENSCKLEVIRQGKEPARFIQALGGILITRRGSSSRSSSSAIFMLCGRKHLGQMVFDEVDFSPCNLCTGYPYVISAMFGKVYLWKGKGSSAEEIGAARLIGMDLGLTGEFEEVAEGEEPSNFFEVFPQHRGTRDYMNSGHWLLKPTHDYFRLRLLRVDHELGQRTFWIRRPGSSSPVIRPNDTVQEIEPFCQKDLSSKGIYVLDTFFEIYVIVGEQASNRHAEFASAVVFAQEYGILAASLQDRPFIPKSFISLGGLPDSCRSAFRKWGRHPAQQSPQLFPLNAAIEAIRS